MLLTPILVESVASAVGLHGHIYFFKERLQDPLFCFGEFNGFIAINVAVWIFI